MIYPKPHSSAWFEVMLLLNTPLAVHTGAVIKAVADAHKIGRRAEQCCGACGDMPENSGIELSSPVADVIITNDHGETWSARLCDDCREIQILNFGLKIRLPEPGEIE